MKRLTSTISATIAVSFFALAASASASDLGIDGRADQYEPAPAQAQVNWTGLWVGAVGGYQFSNSALDFDSSVFDKDGDLVEKTDIGLDGLGAEGLFGELQAGYDHQVSNQFVLGIFGGYNLNDAEFSADASVAYPPAPALGGNVLSFEQEWGGVLGARVGLLKNPDTMFYAAGGWAFGEISQLKSGGVDIFDDQDTDLNGWFGELGMETRVMNNVFLTVSGRYTDYGDITLLSGAGDCNCGFGPDHSYNETLELDHDTLAVMVGLKAKFGGF